MAGKSVLKWAVFLGVFLSLGCCHWCEDHCNSCRPAASCCQPCCAPTTCCQPVAQPAAVPAWNAPHPAPGCCQ
jgi:hypothetical protein